MPHLVSPLQTIQKIHVEYPSCWSVWDYSDHIRAVLEWLKRTCHLCPNAKAGFVDRAIGTDSEQCISEYVVGFGGVGIAIENDRRSSFFVCFVVVSVRVRTLTV